MAFVGMNNRRRSTSFGLILIAICTTNPVNSYTSIPIFYDSSNHLHRDIQYHPEQAARIQLCVDSLSTSKSADLRDISSPTYAFSTEELDHARDMLVAAHSQEFVTSLETRCRNSRQKRLDEGSSALGFVGYVDDDTYVTTESFDVCLRAMASWIRAVDMTIAEQRPTMALTRPPGHHATRATANGFCLFNFAAAAAIHVLNAYPEAKVSIIDWDVHYGQGVADILKHYERSRYVSIHQLNAFPFMGETFKVLGEFSNIMTIPIQADTTYTCGYKAAFVEKALPFVYSPGEWEPSIVIVCAGYDAMDSDELASVSLQASDYGKLVRNMRDHIPPSVPLAFGLEGGYQLRPGAAGGNLGDAVVETVQAMLT